MKKFNIAFKVNNSSVVDIPLTNGMSISTFNSELNKIVVQSNDTLSIFLPNAGVGNISVWNSNIILNRVFSNVISIPFTFNTTNSYDNNGNNQSSTSSNSSYIYYKFTLGENSLTNGLATTLQKAKANKSLVATNIKYVTSSNTYDHTIRQTFQELERMCDSYPRVTSALVQMVGIVSRIIGGSTSATSPWANFQYTNDDWNQVWIPNLEEWITFDSTWNWLTQVGKIQNSLNVYRSRESVCLTMFPIGVNSGDSSSDYLLTNGILFAKLFFMTNTLGTNGNFDQLALYLFLFFNIIK